jgi:AcrR family transcriptional regulator
MSPNGVPDIDPASAETGAVPAGGRPLRRDAVRNRERIVEAALEVFAEQGLQAPIDEVARRAGVGIGTLYRRFPTRPELIACAFTAKMQEYAEATETALANPDPWKGFCWYVERLCEMQAGDHGFTDVLTMTFPVSTEIEQVRAQVFLRYRELVKRAKKAGRLRRDFTTEDVPLILMANAGVIAACGTAAPDAWRRVVRLFLQALEAPARGPLPKPVPPEQMQRAMERR